MIMKLQRFQFRLSSLQRFKKDVPVIGLHGLPVPGFFARETTRHAPPLGTMVFAHIDTGAFLSFTHAD